MALDPTWVCLWRWQEQFIERVMSQVLEVINLARFGAVSSEQAVHLYQQFSLLLAVLGHSASILAFLRNHYHEEFKCVLPHSSFIFARPRPCMDLAFSLCFFLIYNFENYYYSYFFFSYFFFLIDCRHVIVCVLSKWNREWLSERALNCLNQDSASYKFLNYYYY